MQLITIKGRIFQPPVTSNSNAHSATQYFLTFFYTRHVPQIIYHGLELRHPTARIVWISSVMLCDHMFVGQNSESIMRTIARNTYEPWQKYYQPPPYCPEFCSKSIITINSAVYVAKVLHKLNCRCMFKVLTFFFYSVHCETIVKY